MVLYGMVDVYGGCSEGLKNMYAVANPVRGLLDRKSSEGHLLIRSSNESNHKNKNRAKTTKKKGKTKEKEDTRKDRYHTVV